MADESIRKYNRWLQEGGNIKDMEAERAKLRNRITKDSNYLLKVILNQAKPYQLKTLR